MVASIMASEAEFLEPPPEIETVLTKNAGSFKRHTPARFEHSTLLNVTRALNNPVYNTEMKTLETKYLQSRNLSYLSLCMNVEMKPEIINDGPRNSIVCPNIFNLLSAYIRIVFTVHVCAN